MPRAVTFYKPREANYSEIFFSCHRLPSSYPQRKEKKISRLKLARLGIKTKVNKLKEYFDRAHGKATPEACASKSYGTLGRSMRPDGRQISVVHVEDERGEAEQDSGWDAVLERMHRAGVNVAGYEVSEREREACAEARARGLRCGCLGPLAR